MPAMAHPLDLAGAISLWATSPLTYGRGAISGLTEECATLNNIGVIVTGTRSLHY